MDLQSLLAALQQLAAKQQPQQPQQSAQMPQQSSRFNTETDGVKVPGVPSAQPPSQAHAFVAARLTQQYGMDPAMATQISQALLAPTLAPPARDASMFSSLGRKGGQAVSRR